MLISLVVIVRDDARLLAGLLEHHRALYDEAVVVDTGSRDDTVARARAAGARVVPFAWCDDFAAARNAGLAQARGRWVLGLDADERIATRDQGRLRRVARAGRPDRCWLFAFRSYTPLKRHPEWQPVTGEYPDEEAGHEGYVSCVNVRLFPRRDDLRYDGRVHESVERDARRLGLPVVPSDVPIHHYGMVRPREIMAVKDDLYGRLVRAKLRERPQDSGALLEMACRLFEERDSEGAVPLLERLAASTDPDAHAQRGRLYLAHVRRRQGRLDEAESLLRALLAECPHWLQAWVELARTLANAQRWPELAAVVRAGRARFPADPLLWREDVVATAAAGRVPEAARLAAALARSHPGWPEAGALAAALARSPLAAAPGSSPEATPPIVHR